MKDNAVTVWLNAMDCTLNLMIELDKPLTFINILRKKLDFVEEEYE
jgi:hypothetical protein